MEIILEWIAFIVICTVAARFWKAQERDIRPERAIAIQTPAPACLDCWSILGIEPTDDIEEVKKAYRRLIKEHHPDIAGHHSTLKCAEITEAYKEAIGSHTQSTAMPSH